jgi:protein gp37
MSDKTGIEWTEATWNPVTGCSKVSQGCKHCYALREWPRMAAAKHTVYFGRAFTDVMCHPERLEQPLRWKRPRRIFVNSMSDLFHEAVPFEFIDKVFAIMALAPQHTFQVLTKRPERMHCYINDYQRRQTTSGIVVPDCVIARLNGRTNMPELRWPLPNVWLGVSVEDQATADERIPLLMQTPAALRWISAEPLLGPVDLGLQCENWSDDIVMDPETGAYECCKACDYTGVGNAIDWVVVGGESGPKARPTHPDWARSLRDQCAAAGVPFLFKQWGEWQIASHENGHFDSDMARNGAHWVASDGSIHKPSSIGLENPCAMARVGKKAAGRLLDGIQHDGYPEIQP